MGDSKPQDATDFTPSTARCGEHKHNPSTKEEDIPAFTTRAKSASSADVRQDPKPRSTRSTSFPFVIPSIRRNSLSRTKSNRTQDEETKGSKNSQTRSSLGCNNMSWWDRLLSPTSASMERKKIHRRSKTWTSSLFPTPLSREDRLSELQVMWREEILPNWDRYKDSKRLRELLWEGLPPRVRGQAWGLLIGNELRITEELFQIFAKKSRDLLLEHENLSYPSAPPAFSQSPPSTPRRNSQHASDTDSDVDSRFESRADGTGGSSVGSQAGSRANSLPSPHGGRDLGRRSNSGSTNSINSRNKYFATRSFIQFDDAINKEGSVKIIDLDISRTFPKLQFFHYPDGPLYGPLFETLAAYAVYRPDFGYIQGMSYIAAMLLLHLDPRETLFTTFCCFANLLHKRENFSIYSIRNPSESESVVIFKRLFKKHLPELYCHFRSMELHSEMFIISWFIPIFASVLPLEIATRVWDNYLLHGQCFLFRTAVGLLHSIRDKLMASNFEECMIVLTHLRQVIDGETLFNSIQQTRFSSKEIQEIRDKLKT